jgi:calcineurin-like phosphoesterase family protein
MSGDVKEFFVLYCAKFQPFLTCRDLLSTQIQKNHMRIFVISDTHFGHIRLEELGARPIEFSEKIVKNWNRLVNPEDLIIHLGDYVVSKTGIWDQIINQLNGRKILVLGNHDKKSMSWYLSNGFDFVCSSFSWDYYNFKILFSHEPSDLSEYDINIHGHLHYGEHRKDYKLTDRHFLFTMETGTYEPLLLKTMIDKNLNKIQRNQIKTNV